MNYIIYNINQIIQKLSLVNNFVRGIQAIYNTVYQQTLYIYNITLNLNRFFFVNKHFEFKSFKSINHFINFCCGKWSV